MPFATCVCVGRPIPHYTARIRLACRRVIRFTGVRRALWDSLVCHGNPETAVPLAVRFSRCSSSVLTRTLLRPREQRSRVHCRKQRVARACIHIHIRIREYIGVADARKNSVVITQHHVQLSRIRYATCIGNLRISANYGIDAAWPQSRQQMRTERKYIFTKRYFV